MIDIGSNTVRLVVFGGPARSPLPLINEKVGARLGRNLAADGRIPRKAAATALAALRRFRALVEALPVRQVDVVATAAVRDAVNGGEFLEQVRALGLPVRLLSGVEEARTSAAGVIAAFPGAAGVVADLGGGSLELVAVENGGDHDGVSLALGTLRLAALRGAGEAALKHDLRAALAAAGWDGAAAPALYLVGGTWRALARFAVQESGHPLDDPHGFVLSADAADKYARKIARMEPAALRSSYGIAAMRAAALPDAAALLRALLARFAPQRLVFSSWGLREGLLYQHLSPAERAEDPLLAGVAHFSRPRGGGPELAALVADWTAAAAAPDDARLRLAATMLALAAAGLETQLRVAHALDWALHKRWTGIDGAGRARLAAALLGASGKTALPGELLELEREPALRAAIGWGLAVRLCRRTTAASPVALAQCQLLRDGPALVLAFSHAGRDLASDTVLADLTALARWLGLEPQVRLDPA